MWDFFTNEMIPVIDKYQLQCVDAQMAKDITKEDFEGTLTTAVENQPLSTVRFN